MEDLTDSLINSVNQDFWSGPYAQTMQRVGANYPRNSRSGLVPRSTIPHVSCHLFSLEVLESPSESSTFPLKTLQTQNNVIVDLNSRQGNVHGRLSKWKQGFKSLLQRKEGATFNDSKFLFVAALLQKRRGKPHRNTISGQAPHI